MNWLVISLVKTVYIFDISLYHVFRRLFIKLHPLIVRCVLVCMLVLDTCIVLLIICFELALSNCEYIQICTLCLCKGIYGFFLIWWVRPFTTDVYSLSLCRAVIQLSPSRRSKHFNRTILCICQVSYYINQVISFMLKSNYICHVGAFFL